MPAQAAACADLGIDPKVVAVWSGFISAGKLDHSFEW